MLKQKKFHCELEEIPLIGKSIANTLRDHGIDSVTQLIELNSDNPLFEMIYPLPLIVNYAKAIVYGKTIINKANPVLFTYSSNTAEVQ